MGTQPLILVGGGGHAAVVAGAAARAGMKLLGVLDDGDSALANQMDALGPTEQLKWVLSNHAGAGWVLAIGDLRTRRAFLRATGDRAADRATSVIDPGAVVLSDATVGHGSFVAAGAVVQARATVGPHAIINTGAIVEHDCTIGENTHVAPGAVLGGSVTVGHDTLIGLGARVKPGVTVGSGVTVGVGAVVIDDIADGQTVVGVPARALGSAVR